MTATSVFVSRLSSYLLTLHLRQLLRGKVLSQEPPSSQIIPRFYIEILLPLDPATRSIIEENVYWPALAMGSTTLVVLKGTTSPAEVVMAGSESPAMASRTAISSNRVRNARGDISVGRKTYLLQEPTWQWGSQEQEQWGMQGRRWRTAWLRCSRNEDKLAEKECIGKESTCDELNDRIERKTEKENFYLTVAWGDGGKR